jgi:hypothetical protein
LLALDVLRRVPEHLARDARDLLGVPVALTCVAGLFAAG